LILGSSAAASKELRKQAKTYSRANIPEGTAIVSPFGIPDDNRTGTSLWTNVQTPIDVNGDDATLDGQLVVFDFDVRGK